MRNTKLKTAVAGAGESLLGISAGECIIFVPQMEAFGGGERLILALSRYLHDCEMQHRVVCYYDNIDLASYADWPLRVDEICTSRNPLQRLLAFKRFIHRIRREGAKLPLLVGIQAALHAGLTLSKDYTLLMLDTPSLLTTRIVAGGKVSKVIQGVRGTISLWLTRRGVRSASNVLVMTRYTASEVERLYGVHSSVVRPGVPVGRTELKAVARAPRGTLHVLSVSRLERNKRLDWVLRALAELDSGSFRLGKRVDWVLDIVGGGSRQEELKRLATHLGLEERINFRGHVSEAKLEEIYSRANLFLMPAVQGYGLPALEALARGIPVVMHRESGVSEIFLEETPWVELIDGDMQAMCRGIGVMIQRLLTEDLCKHAVPEFPTDKDWAVEVSKLCGWI